MQTVSPLFPKALKWDKQTKVYVGTIAGDIYAVEFGQGIGRFVKLEKGNQNVIGVIHQAEGNQQGNPQPNKTNILQSNMTQAANGAIHFDYTSSVNKLRYSQNGLLLSCNQNGRANVYDVRTMQKVQSYSRGRNVSLLSADFDPSNNLIAGCHRDHIFVWDMRTTKLMTQYTESFAGNVTDVRIREGWIYGCCEGGMVNRFDSRIKKEDDAWECLERLLEVPSVMEIGQRSEVGSMSSQLQEPAAPQIAIQSGQHNMFSWKHDQQLSRLAVNSLSIPKRVINFRCIPSDYQRLSRQSNKSQGTKYPFIHATWSPASKIVELWECQTLVGCLGQQAEDVEVAEIVNTNWIIYFNEQGEGRAGKARKDQVYKVKQYQEYAATLQEDEAPQEDVVSTSTGERGGTMMEQTDEMMDHPSSYRSSNTPHRDRISQNSTVLMQNGFIKPEVKKTLKDRKFKPF